MTCDFTKPGFYRTRDGRKAEVLYCIPERYPVLFPIRGIVIDGGNTFEYSWDLSGYQYKDGGANIADLIGPWREPVTLDGWVNVYGNDTSTFHRRKGGADYCAMPGRIDCRKLRYVEGKGFTDVTEEA